MVKTMNNRTTTALRGGFTLIEILAVVVIIGILLAIGLAVGPELMGRGQKSETRIALQNCASILNVYQERTGVVPRNINASFDWQIYKDAYLTSGGGGQDLTIDEDANEKDMIQQMKSRSIFQFAAATYSVPEIRAAWYNNRQIQFESAQGHILLTDGWGTPLVYCDGHPETLEGPAAFLPPHQGPFFASAGPDGAWGDYRMLERARTGENLNDWDQEAADAAGDNIYSFDLGT